MLIDSHCHLFHDKYNKKAADIVVDAVSEGVTRMICIGTSLEENIPVLKAVDSFPEVYGAIGIYPHDDLDIPVPVLMEKLEKQVKTNQKIVAIGECGIDITDWHGGRNINDQLILFEEQLKLAVKLKLPVVIHNRNGDAYVVELVKKYISNGLRGVIHCFVSNQEFAINMLNLGFYLSFSGNITYPSNRELREIVANVPNDRFLVETDSPYLPPQGHRGEVNEPKYVKIVAEKVADVKTISFEKACEYAYNNTCTLFNII